MVKALLLPAAIGLMMISIASAQEANYGAGYQTLMISNPAFAGCEGDGIMRLSYLNFYPGRSYNLHTFYASYDAFYPVLHGGAGIFISNDYSGGIMNEVRGGLNYSYHLQAGEEIFINAGLSASFFHRGFNQGNMVFPDQIDPLQGAVLQTGETEGFRNRTVFDAGAGFVVIAGRYLAGFSVSHLAEPDLSGAGREEEKLHRKATLHLSGLFPAGTGEKAAFRPMVYGELQNRNFVAGAGTSFETPVFSVSSLFLYNKAGDMNLQAGISFNIGQFFVFYNYTFNLVSVNSLLPLSLVQHAGMGISLNYVDKRKTIKTINFPEL